MAARLTSAARAMFCSSSLCTSSAELLPAAQVNMEADGSDGTLLRMPSTTPEEMVTADPTIPPKRWFLWIISGWRPSCFGEKYSY